MVVFNQKKLLFLSRDLKPLHEYNFTQIFRETDYIIPETFILCQQVKQMRLFEL